MLITAFETELSPANRNIPIQNIDKVIPQQEVSTPITKAPILNLNPKIFPNQAQSEKVLEKELDETKITNEIKDVRKAIEAIVTEDKSIYSLVEAVNLNPSKPFDNVTPKNATLSSLNNSKTNTDEGVFICEHSMFLCADGSDCLEYSKTCDGVQHCLDNSDEYNCSNSKPPTTGKVLDFYIKVLQLTA